MDTATLNAILADLKKYRPSIEVTAKTIQDIAAIFKAATGRDSDLTTLIVALKAQVAANDTAGNAEIERLRALITPPQPS